MRPAHWAHFQRVIQAESQRRGLSDLSQAFALIPELWEKLKDETAAEREADRLELADLELNIPKAEESLDAMKSRRDELATGPLRVDGV